MDYSDLYNVFTSYFSHSINLMGTKNHVGLRMVTSGFFCCIECSVRLGIHHELYSADIVPCISFSRCKINLTIGIDRSTTMVFNHDSEAMESNAPPSLPFERRDSYKPHDPGTHLKLQQLRCVQSDAFDSSVIDPLCSLCKEVLLGEPLLDGNDNDTEYRIPLYALPCGHLRW